MKKLDPPVKSVILSNYLVSLSPADTAHNPSHWAQRKSRMGGTYLKCPGDEESRQLPCERNEEGDGEIVLVNNDVRCHLVLSPP